MEVENTCNDVGANIAVCNRHTFILSDTEKQNIWKTVEKLLTDNQVEASSMLILICRWIQLFFHWLRVSIRIFYDNVNLINLDS